MSGAEDSPKHVVVDGKPGLGDEYLSDDEEPQEGPQARRAAHPRTIRSRISTDLSSTTQRITRSMGFNSDGQGVYYPMHIHPIVDV